MQNYTEMNVKDLVALPGIGDRLPAMVAGKFAQALKREAAGDLEEAERLLNEAVEAEQQRMA